ncbi:hypothetical protein E2C00_00220 [Streptomyces sp. WAC05374]|uniref:hypothetical protein n=1 Tax=Streptomyces sp. WAC05374 TaxID=2487420 RepID=UPI000F885FFD|nr:hypothetical protein [Streptomyces sp. WAC05374]RST19693.1 hypothetical protein EF905_00730 [Streptomyces sp. WAC05374]TDF50824.1 hypothetical protein E2B92_00190 [Streptomyces sp. WAC05374]TDF58072.1 hypothetical protein E2C02_07985 [Streptomyces sp. WAC05374]TDF61076.1 hypothetical protein E2C00_00220 [Streptomyces sp. WAC05374]
MPASANHATARILTGEKIVENRPQPSWRPGWVLLHAAKQIDRTTLREPLVARTICGRDLVTGAVVGLARITGSHQDPKGSPPCSPWAQPGVWHLVLDDVQELALPILIERGQLGPWRPSPDLVTEVLQQLPHLPP